MSDTIVYEHPLSEKIRCYLRVEHLADQIDKFGSCPQGSGFKPFFAALFTLSEIVDRGELKKELIRDLDNHKLALAQWRLAEGIDKNQLNQLLAQIESFCFFKSPANKAQQLLTNDPLLNQVKNKMSLPGGGALFDTPLLHFWQHLPLTSRQQDISRWLKPFQMTIDAITLLLHLLRQSSPYLEKLANDAFYQDSCDKNQLLRIKLEMQQGCYPTVSGHRNRYAIRFIAWNEQPLHDIKFALSCC